MLNSPSHAVLGVSTLERAIDYLKRFGFELTAKGRLDGASASALYGLDGACREARLDVPGARAGWLRLIETPHAALHVGPYDHRPLAFDLYTRDLEQSIDLARSGGALLGQTVEYSLGELSVKEIETTGPAGVNIVFLEVDPRRPSVLDRDADRLHSEVHSIVFAVPSVDDELTVWRDRGGLEVLIDAPITGPHISQLMNLPRPDVPVRFALLCDDDESPARLEVICFDEDPGSKVATLPLRPGLHAPAFTVTNLAEAKQALEGCRFRPLASPDTAVHRQAQGVSGVTPGGLRFELWQQA